MAGGLLHIEGLVRNYGRQRGVGPLDLYVEPGIHGLLGPNGSGKTTLIKTLLGFLPPTAGRASVLGHDIVADRLQVRRRVGYMAENDVIVPGLTPVQTVRLAGELCGMPPGRAHEAAAEAFNAVDLGEERYHAPQRLSTGQRQKVKLAAALVHAPGLLFLDEPTNGLDPRGRRAMLHLIEELSREKDISVILSTHILPDVEAVCRDAIVLREGRLVAVEPVSARTVRKQGTTKTWFDIDVAGDPTGFLKACKTARMDIEEVGGSIRVAARDADQVLKAAAGSKTLLTRVRPGTAGVEDAVLGHLEGSP